MLLTQLLPCVPVLSFVAAAACCMWNACAPAVAAEPAADFERAIAPLLARRCLDCHNSSDRKGGLDLTNETAARAGGDSGPVLMPGDPAQSVLWKRIENGEMPPKQPLSIEERRMLKSWIAAGAKWSTHPIDRFRFTTESRAGYDWWSLAPLEPVSIPNSKTPHGGWVRNPIDQLVLTRLEAAGLQPSPEADRRTLIRRLSFDLLGLPPAPDAVAAFLADDDPGAYDRLVDRMLASPHYGQRWGRHWLDVVRFGESQGFERDRLRPNAWRYRDWVVDALNADTAYDEFARLQLAGDVLQPGNPRAIVATGFLVAGPYDEVGQNQQSAAMKAVVRQDELEDMISLVGQTFLGLTINCARCHDHKFDPVTQREYYQLAAALAGVRHGERSIGNASMQAEAAHTAAALQARIDDLAAQLSSLDEPIRQQILAERRRRQAEATPPEPIAQWDFDANLEDARGTMHGTAVGRASVKNGRLEVDGRTGYVVTAPLPKPLREKTLEAWVQLPNLDQRGGGVISLQTLNGEIFDAIVFGERQPRRWMAGSNHFARTRDVDGPNENDAAQEVVHIAVTYSADGTIAVYRNGQPYGQPYQVDKLVTFPAGEAQVVFGLRHTPAGGNRLLAGAIERAQLYDRALTADQIAASAGVLSEHVSQDELLGRMTAADKLLREQLQFEVAQLREHRKRAEQQVTYAVAPRDLEPTHLLLRGNPAQKGDVVAPGGVAAIADVSAAFQLPGDASDADRREKLAAWITDRHNPLFARVIVNRLWHYHFGVGLVETPSDFGFNGGRPTHAELIDWLAAELIRREWSLKAIHRLIVTSATYRQASRYRSEAAELDAGNRLLWRKTPLRLEAEAIRDAMLSVAGVLQEQVGGPGYYDFTTFIRNTQFYEPVDGVGETLHRRSVYRTWVRSGRNAFLDVFDCPDPSTKTPKRAVTTTPLQALSLLNNSFVLQMSERLAERLPREVGDDLRQQITRGYQLAYGRPPDAEELALTADFVATHGLPALCRVLFGSNEFLYVD